MSAPRIPVSLVTGFLGSGKTTLIARLLERPQLAATLVIVNEFGEVGIDHDLLEASSDDTILLANGCLCCTIRGNLVDTLNDVLAQQAQGRLREFDRVVVETSGVADPGPILGFVFGEARVAERFRPGRVITTCDAVTGAAVLARHPEAVSQVVHAELLLITKSDLATPETIAALAARLRALNPAATVRPSCQGDGLAPDDLDSSMPPIASIDGRAHLGRFRTLVLEARRPLAMRELSVVVGAIRRTAGPELLRLKGLVALADAPGCAVIQATPGFVHDVARLDTHAPQPGRLVLIADAALSPALLASLAAFGIEPAAALHSAA